MPGAPIKVLFVCIHNSARSQMAAAYLNHYGAGRFVAESAGLEPGTLTPRVVQVMQEEGIDLSGNRTKSVFDLLQQQPLFQYVVTVCDPSAAEKCPVFPGVTKRLHWSFKDPSALTGSEQDKLRETRQIRDQIKVRVREWLAEFSRESGQQAASSTQADP